MKKGEMVEEITQTEITVFMEHKQWMGCQLNYLTCPCQTIIIIFQEEESTWVLQGGIFNSTAQL